MTELRPIAEGREKAEALRFDQSLGAGPIRDLFGLIEQLDDRLLLVRRPLPGGPDAVVLGTAGRRVLVVNTADRVLRQQRFSAAHGFAHVLFEAGDPAFSLHVDRTVLGDVSPMERRADAFAAHLLVPATAVRLRLGTHDPLTWNREQLVLMSMDFGISIRGLLWHIRHVLPLDEAARRHLAAVREPTPEEALYVASRAGRWELVRDGRSARGAIGWPSRFVALAARAYDRGQVSPRELEVLLEDHGLTAEIIELGRAAGAGPNR